MIRSTLAREPDPDFCPALPLILTLRIRTVSPIFNACGSGVVFPSEGTGGDA